MIMTSITISFIVVMGSFYLNTIPGHYDKLSQYECGFEPEIAENVSFYLKFYMIGILFLIFDLEALLLYPYTTLNQGGFIVFFTFMVILILGLIYEYRQGVI
jgi:NADH-quinone oxidoreductase subunit A